MASISLKKILKFKEKKVKYQGRIQGGGRNVVKRLKPPPHPGKIPIYSPVKFYNEEGCSLKSIYKNLLQLFSLSKENSLLFSVIIRLYSNS